MLDLYSPIIELDHSILRMENRFVEVELPLLNLEPFVPVQSVNPLVKLSVPKLEPSILELEPSFLNLKLPSFPKLKPRVLKLEPPILEPEHSIPIGTPFSKFHSFHNKPGQSSESSRYVKKRLFKGGRSECAILPNQHCPNLPRGTCHTVNNIERVRGEII